MREFDIRKTQYAVTDFLNWQRDGSLDLNPPFQRRSVWKPDARSYFIDTVVKGLPSPIIYLRESLDLKTQDTVREVVDGQQRLRTVLSYIDPDCIDHFDENRDRVVVKEIHNQDLAGKSFNKLQDHFRRRILEYQFSTHVLPIAAEDREVLEMFSRLNATGVKLNEQELRNANYYGQFKTLMYALALEQFDRWREWKVFTDDQISRMKEVETASDLVMNMVSGLTGKLQKRINDMYEQYDDNFPRSKEVARRFRQTMDEIDQVIGNEIQKTVFKSEVHFFSLFVLIYQLMYGLGSPLARRKANKLPRAIRRNLKLVSDRFAQEEVPPEILDAVQRASSDLGRRRTRLQYMIEVCG